MAQPQLVKHYLESSKTLIEVRKSLRESGIKREREKQQAHTCKGRVTCAYNHKREAKVKLHYMWK